MNESDTTADAAPREAFIPFLRRDLVEMCLRDEGLTDDYRDGFRDLCEILVSHLHFEFHRTVEGIKEHYAPFNPDRETRSVREGGPGEAEHEEALVQLFRTVAERANYAEIGADRIRECFEAVTLIDLRTHVDLEDFERVVCFARGDVFKTTTVKKWFRRREVRVDVLQRVLLLLKYKDASHFAAKKKRRSEAEEAFQPGKIYTYFYKDVPKFDLELLFPNVEVGMNFKDKVLFAVPAVGGSIGVLAKALPQVLIIVGAILFFTAGPTWALKVGVTEDSVRNFMPVVTALMGVVMALGGLAFKQWSSYRKKRIAFLKDVSEQLFFRNLATNRSVFHRLVDSAEEEEGKEMILVLHHLLTGPAEGLTRSELDARIEGWMEERFGEAIDFDIAGALGNLANRRGPTRDGADAALVEEGPDGRLRALPVEDAKHVLDHLWDSAYGYAG